MTLRFFLEAVATQSIDALERARRLTDLQMSLRDRVTDPRSSSLLTRLVDALFENPSLTIARVVAITDTSTSNAYNLIERLVDRGVVVEATGRSKNRVFICPEIIGAVHVKRHDHSVS